MLTSITPLGERGRGMRWGVTAGTHVLGSTLGGAMLGAGAGALGALLTLAVGTRSVPVVLAVAAAVTLAAAVADAARAPVPTLRRQVDEQWLGRYRGWVYGGGFGVQLGLGLTTVVTTWAVHLMVVLAVLTGSVTAGAVLGAVFGLGRALPVLTMARANNAAMVAARLRGVAHAARGMQRATVVVLVGVAGITGTAAVTASAASAAAGG